MKHSLRFWTAVAREDRWDLAALGVMVSIFTFTNLNVLPALNARAWDWMAKTIFGLLTDNPIWIEGIKSSFEMILIVGLPLAIMLWAERARRRENVQEGSATA